MLRPWIKILRKPNFMREFRDKKANQGLLAEIRNKVPHLEPPVKIMEVCGTHTMTIHKFGLREVLKASGVEMISGPGCPVCITPNGFHEAAIDMVEARENFILTTFGDMTRVPTQRGSLQKTVPAKNSKIKIVYSPQESLDLALNNPDKDVIFFGVGFETTIPAIAFVVESAYRQKIKNFSVLSALWTIPAPLRALVSAKNVAIDGFLYPGHVSVIIGEKPYQFIADEFGIPGSITGFEPNDILLAILSILDQKTAGKPEVDNSYSRVVRPTGNPTALKIMERVLEPYNACWRGLGIIPRSGLKIKSKYEAFDAEKKYSLSIPNQSEDLKGCRCGEVLQGRISPPQCPMFAKKCHPESPYGPCMVSFEGACLAFYKYSRNRS